VVHAQGTYSKMQQKMLSNPLQVEGEGGGEGGGGGEGEGEGGGEGG